MAGIKEGEQIPHFALPDQEGNIRTAEEFRGKPLILFFYPRDETPGCVREACSFRDNYEKFLRSGVHVVGVSSDSKRSHKKFSEKYNLPFLLLSDKNNTLKKAIGVSSAFLGLIPGRETFVFDREGILRFRFKSQYRPRKHVTEVLEVIEAMGEEGVDS